MRSIKVLIVSIILTAAVFAQDETIRVETNLVTLNVSVTDGRGRPVPGLTEANFTVFDNGVRQEIDSFSLPDASMSFGVIYDLHQTSDEQIGNILAALRSFTTSLRNEDDYFVNVIGDGGSLMTEFVPTQQQIRDNVINGERGPNNSLYDSIFRASEKLAQARNSKRVLIVLTDGTDRSSHHSLKELTNHLRSINLPVYSITFGGNDRRQFSYIDVFRGGPLQTFPIGEYTELDRGVVAEISRTSGGETFEGSVRNRVYLAALFSKVVEDIKNQYVIGFYPERLDGKYHKLKVTAEGQARQKLRTSSRKGYISKKTIQGR